MWTNESDCVPIKLYLWKQRAVLIWPINLWAANPVVDYRADVKDNENNLQVLTGKDIHSMCGVVVLHAQLCLTICNPWTVVCQAPLSMEVSRQECWNGLPFHSSGDRPDTGIEPGSPALQADSLPSDPSGKPIINSAHYRYILVVILSLFVVLFLLKR